MTHKQQTDETTICNSYEPFFHKDLSQTCKFRADDGSCRKREFFMCWDYLYYDEGRTYLKDMDLDKHP